MRSPAGAGNALICAASIAPVDFAMRSNYLADTASDLLSIQHASFVGYRKNSVK